MLILGIDPGTRITGYGLIRSHKSRYTHVDNGCIRPQNSLPISDRLTFIFNHLEELIKSFEPDTVVLERAFVAKNASSALKLGQCRGLAIAAAGRAHLPVFEYSPNEIKQAVTGSGRASKDQVQKMVRMLLALPEIALPDASDALAVALCHAQSYGFPK